MCPLVFEGFVVDVACYKIMLIKNVVSPLPGIEPGVPG